MKQNSVDGHLSFDEMNLTNESLTGYIQVCRRSICSFEEAFCRKVENIPWSVKNESTMSFNGTLKHSFSMFSKEPEYILSKNREKYILLKKQ